MAVRYTDASGTAAEWAVSTLVLAIGQHGYDITNRAGKVGDGISLWADLPWQIGSIDHSIQDIRALTQSKYNDISVKNPSTLYVITS